MSRDGANNPAYTRLFWAKWDKDVPGRIHLLEHHLADVGACFQALLSQPTIRRRLAQTAGMDDLQPAIAARLSVFAALHDIGKVNVGFQTRTWEAADRRGQRRVDRAGHTADIVPVLTGEDVGTSEWFLDSLGWEELLGWDSDGGETACAMFAAAMSHHGEPLDLYDSLSTNPGIWRSFGELRPERCVQRIGSRVRRWFPDAFEEGAPPLPSEPAFQHMFLGLCTLADWIGSDERFFEYCDTPSDDYIEVARERARGAVANVGIAIDEQRLAFDARGNIPEFGRLFGIEGGAPNAIQRAMTEAPLDEPLLVIESETGSGKTEAALWRFAKMYEAGLVDGLYFALPTRTAAIQIHGRVNEFARRMFPSGYAPEATLAVPGYVRSGDFTGRHLSNYKVWWDDHSGGDPAGQRWAAEGAKRFLAAQIAVGTVDQAMMAALQVRHAHMRAASLARNLLIVDEVHASDPYMRVIIKGLLDAHIGAGGYAILMSATLGSAARREWVAQRRHDADGRLHAGRRHRHAVPGSYGSQLERRVGSRGRLQRSRQVRKLRDNPGYGRLRPHSATRAGRRQRGREGGSPACAGIDPSAYAGVTSRVWLPRVRGDRSKRTCLELLGVWESWFIGAAIRVPATASSTGRTFAGNGR